MNDKSLRHFIYATMLLEGRKKYKDYNWTPWSEAAQQVEYKPLQAGVGPGEDRLAIELDGEVQGGSVSYDVVDKDGRKWEVKEPTKSFLIRVGTEGRAAAARTKAAFNAINRRIEEGFEKIQNEGIPISDILKPQSLELVGRYIQKDIPMIKKGEIPRGRVARMRNVMLIISELVTQEKDSDIEKSLEMGDNEHKIQRDVNLRTYIRIGDVLNIPKEELRVEDTEIMAAAFDDEAFRDVDGFFQEFWVDAIKPKDIFGHTSGVIFVNPAGYKIVDVNDLDKELTFYIITQGVPQFRLKREKI